MTTGQRVTVDHQLAAMSGVQLDACQAAVPGRHEARFLADCCPRCHQWPAIRPVVVIDELRGKRIVGRYGVYRCPSCDADWLCWWASPQVLRRSR